MNYYKCSDGSRISKAEIDKKTKQAKIDIIHYQKDWYSYNFCEDCKEFGVPETADTMELMILDCSHEKSVDWCQKNGCCELAWDRENIRIRCRYHHRKHDKLDLKFIKFKGTSFFPEKK